MLEAAILVIFPLCMAFAAFSDLFTMTIPNRVSLILILAFLIIAPLAGMPLPMMAMHVLGAALVFAVCFGLFAANVMGGGDAKFLTASALWFGFGLDLVAFMVTIALLGGLLTLTILMMRSQRGYYLMSYIPMSQNLTNSKGGVPYGIAIGAAGLISYPASPVMLYAFGPLF